MERSDMPLSRHFAAVLLLGFVAVLCSAPAKAAPPKDATAFTNYVLKRMRAAMPGVALRSEGPLIIELRGSEGGVGHAFLNRIWTFCQTNDPARCDAEIARFVAEGASGAAADGRAQVSQSTLRVVLRPVAQLINTQRAAGNQKDAALVVAPFAGDLRMALVFDRPTDMKFVLAGDLAALGLTKEQAFVIGMKNLDASLKPLPQVMMGVPGEAVDRSDGDDYESGRVVLHETLAELSGFWDGQLLVAIPGTHTVLYADGRRPDAVPAMRAAIQEEIARSAHPLSATLFRWTPSGWDVVAR